MATKAPKTTKAKTPSDEKFTNQDFDLFEALSALDRKDYGYYDRLTPEQKKKFSPYMMIQWMSSIKADGELGAYMVMSTQHHANHYFFNEKVQQEPKLQWLMLCAASPGLGKQYHAWIPQWSDKISKLKESPKVKDIKEYYAKIYPGADNELLTEVANAFVDDNKKKVYLAKAYPGMPIEDIETLAQLITDEDIANYERDSGAY